MLIVFLEAFPIVVAVVLVLDILWQSLELLRTRRQITRLKEQIKELAKEREELLRQLNSVWSNQ